MITVEETELWNKLLLLKNEDFFILLDHVFVILGKLQNLDIDYSHYEKFLYKGILVKVPIEIYFILCISRFNKTTIEDEKYYFANCAIRAYNKTKFKKLRAKYNTKDLYKYHIKNYRAKYETLYGKDISNSMKNNLKIKMATLSGDIIKNRNSSIRRGMLNYWRHQKT